MVIRTYRCLKDGCDKLFDSTGDNPRCPACKSRRIRWVPDKLALGKVAKGIDQDLRNGAEAYGLTNLKSARAGEKAKPDPTFTKMAAHNFGGGWTGGVPVDSSGRILGQAACTYAPGMSSRIS